MTRRNFISALGATALISGETIASPVRSAIGARIGLFGADGELKNPYVQDGMIAMWDAEWNVGLGQHEDSPMTWVNLAGNGLDMISNGNPIFFDKYIQPTQQSEMWHTDITDLCDEMLEYGTMTMEVVSHVVIGKNGPKLLMFGGGGFNQGCHVSATCGDSLRVGFNVRVGTTETFKYSSQNPFAYFALVSDGSVLTGLYKSKSGVITRNVEVQPPITNYVSKRFMIGYRYTYYPDSPMVNGEKVYSIRVYNRPLTELEIGNNYLIDKLRFGI